MTDALTWHSSWAADRAVYHDNSRCLEGDAIQWRYRRSGALCEHCAGYARRALPDLPPVQPSPMPLRPSREPVLRQTSEDRCPYCRSHRITPAAQGFTVGALIKEVHRCEVCKTIFLIARAAIV